ncbi:MAG: formylglycine-generating enzyme family protein, partial [Planctomycetales bacterium]|nr:formylglycine-generating enzyme family protein [Planctomycetales bacterium]
SSSGRRSFESDKIKHGVFTYVLLQGLRGQAPKNSRGEITWLTLASYIIDEVPLQVPLLLDDPDAEQRPNLMGNLIRQPVLARLDVKPPLVKPALLRSPFTATEAGQAQRAWSDYLKIPERTTDKAGISLVLIPPGEFAMGSTQSERERMLRLFPSTKAEDYADETQHQVRITQPFYLSAHEVTVGQFRQFVSETSYRTEAETDGEGGYGWNEAEGKFEGPDVKYNWRNTGFPQDDNHPVVNVSWNDAQKFCQWLSRKEGQTYGLPTEAQWEYSCRGGTTTAWSSGDDPETLAQVGNVADGTAKAKYPSLSTIAAKDGYVFTAPVGRFRGNSFGLFDMHGNVWEWCQDGYDANYYAVSPT